MTFRRAAKVDANQPEIVEAFRKMGCSVLIISQLKGCLDLVVAKNRKTVIVEVKDGSKPPSARQLTPLERVFLDAWRGEAVIVESLDDVLRVVKELEA
ncbi:hypothetical protein [Nitrosovibrio sp. Nv4]|uniref:hypothetical protein n=1 Tax=Nitrosovibrio sp. Nv4 TaxID=1945880 RepID=UPI000BD16D0B|nr:hypothetical protein [Nitrosovibrio sp. Nv4]SOD42395.1 hypothetical protein SAMN06298226_2734 [Nitrosovibrio sp. Nv4]